MAFPSRLGIFFGYSLLGLFALATLGCLVPSIPVLGSLGPLLVSAYGPWITILSLPGAIAVLFRWRKTGGVRTLAVVSLAVFAALGTAVIQARQIAVASSNGIDINLLPTFSLSDGQHAPAPVLENYSHNEGQDLPIAIYPTKAASGGSLMPILVYVHGGGWGGGSLHDRPSDMQWFAAQGFLVISVEYTLSSAERHTWDLAPAQVGCALIWIANNAERYGGDASRLTMIGESAGGNLALNVAYQASASLLRTTCKGTLPRIGAVVAGYPIIDALLMYENQDLIAGRFARQMTTHYTGGTPEQVPDRYAAISSQTHIHSEAPPTLLMPGLADHLLPPEPVYAFADKAQAAGVDVRVIAFPYGEHSFDQKSGSIGSQLFRGATLQFLEQQGLAP